jgi:isopentenyl-diphosphate delta-isomerase
MVVSVDEYGSMGVAVPRRDAHRSPGVLHLAVSVQIFDPAAGWLLQRRAQAKAAFPGRWANSCCTHPAPGEDLAAAVIRRVREELGLVLAAVIPAGIFTYRAVDRVSGLVEHEQDHVFAAVAATASADADAGEISELARLPYNAAVDLVLSDLGAPWSAQVLRMAAAVVDGH